MLEFVALEKMLQTGKAGRNISRRQWLARCVSGGAMATGFMTLPGCGPGESSTDQKLTNVSYDPTREFYEEYNVAFAQYWYTERGESVGIRMSHGGSGRQSRAVMDGLPADVVSLALALDIDMIAERTGLIATDWRTRFPHNASPYQSTIVFIVRRGNPKGIHDWEDLVRNDIQVITPHPKTSGAARYNFLAAWGYILKRELGDFTRLAMPDAPEVIAAEAAAENFLRRMYQNVPVLDSGARGSTMMFVRNRVGDVLLNWENEAFLAMQEAGGDELEMIVPKLSVLAEPPVAVVDSVAKKRGTTKLAHAYLEHLYSPEGQTLAAKHFYRPSWPDVVDPSLLKGFATPEMFSVDEVFGGWQKAQERFFNDHGIFDRIFQPK